MLFATHLGRVDYGEALALQEELVQRRKEDRLGDTLFLLEHPPVLTLGRNSKREHILADDRMLEQHGVSVVETNRGGDVTYHGPGQLVGYPILDLRGLTPRTGAIEYVRKLEEVLIRCCADYGILTERVAGRTGVWTMAGGQIREKKIAAIGVHISRGVTSHGFALNLMPDLRAFSWIVPCGIADRGVTSIEEEIDTHIHAMPSMMDIAHTITRHFSRVFAQPVLWIESLQELKELKPDGNPPPNTAARQPGML